MAASRLVNFLFSVGSCLGLALDVSDSQRMFSIIYVEWMEREFRYQWNNIGKSLTSADNLQSTTPKFSTEISKQWNQYLEEAQSWFQKDGDK